MLDRDQPVNAVTNVNFDDVIENFVGTPLSDLVFVDVSATDRDLDGGPETSIPPGDRLIVDFGHQPAALTKTPHPGKIGSVDGSAKGSGFSGTIDFTDFESVLSRNAGPTGGFHGAGGPFTAATNYLVDKAPRGAQLAQLNDDNGDGVIDDLDNLDMVTANSGAKTVSVRLGNGFGTFGPATKFASGGYGTTVALGDLDGDGDQDAVVALRAANKLGVLLNNGDGSFAAPTTFTTGINKHAKNGLAPTSVKLADLNNDGNLDAVTANAVSNTVSILAGDGAGGFGPVGSAKTFKTGGLTPRDLVLADFNQDGNTDVVVTNLNSANVGFLSGNGDGRVNAAVKFATGSQPTSVVAVDFNADGNLDIATTNQLSKTISVMLGNGAAGTPQFQEELRISYPLIALDVSLTAGDLNGDGNVDLVIANRVPNTLSILLGVGNGTFTNRFDNTVGSLIHRQPVSIALGDLNHDGLLDIIVANPGSHEVSVLLRNSIL